ncbi:MAG: multicopper oxidase domain-containing protein [Actinomycetota bacterium]
MKNRPRFTPVALVLCLAFGVLGSLPTSAQPSQACDSPDDTISLFADNVGRNRIGYGFTPRSVSIPGPTIVMQEGECLAINLVNDTRRQLSFHPHGVDYTVVSDGTPHNLGCVRPGRSKTYVISTHLPGTRTDGTIDAGSAGYWHYHDHCMGTSHGTGGIDMGLFGAIIVRRVGDPEPARAPFIVVFKDRTINLRRAPRTPIFRANIGERIEFVVIGHGEDFHTFHLHGHRWSDNRTGVATSIDEAAPSIDNKTVGPADSFGFQVVAGEHVGEGAWMYHCHVQGHSDTGMAGLLVVRGPDGKMSPSTQAAVKRWKRIESGHH